MLSHEENKQHFYSSEQMQRQNPHTSNSINKFYSSCNKNPCSIKIQRWHLSLAIKHSLCTKRTNQPEIECAVSHEESRHWLIQGRKPTKGTEAAKEKLATCDEAFWWMAIPMASTTTMTKFKANFTSAMHISNLWIIIAFTLFFCSRRHSAFAN